MSWRSHISVASSANAENVVKPPSTPVVRNRRSAARSSSPRSRGSRVELPHREVHAPRLVIHRERPRAVLCRHLSDERIRVGAVLVEDRQGAVAAARDVDQSSRGIEFGGIDAGPDRHRRDHASGVGVDNREHAAAASDEDALVLLVHVHRRRLAARRHVPPVEHLESLQVRLVRRPRTKVQQTELSVRQLTRQRASEAARRSAPPRPDAVLPRSSPVAGGRSAVLCLPRCRDRR